MTDKQKDASDKNDNKDVGGEGNYTATRNFDKAEERFVKENKDRIPEMGKKAAEALDGEEGKDLRSAEERAKSHSKSKNER